MAVVDDIDGFLAREDGPICECNYKLKSGLICFSDHAFDRFQNAFHNQIAAIVCKCVAIGGWVIFTCCASVIDRQTLHVYR